MFDEEERYGFIRPADGGQDVHVGSRVLDRAKIASLRKGQEVEFKSKPVTGKSPVVTDLVRF